MKEKEILEKFLNKVLLIKIFKNGKLTIYSIYPPLLSLIGGFTSKKEIILENYCVFSPKEKKLKVLEKENKLLIHSTKEFIVKKNNCNYLKISAGTYLFFVEK